MGAASGCPDPASIPDFGEPDVSQILVFYPVGGLVRGRGLADAAPLGASHVFIKAHPNGSETIRPVDADGGFEFSILARGGNVLEISGATDSRGTSRGAPAFIKVPTGTLSDVDYVCCLEGRSTEGTCQTVAERERELERTDGLFECPSPQTGRTRCVVDEDCGFEEGEWLRVDLDRINVTRPNSGGFIAVSGFVEPRSLVTLQNRGLSGIGAPQDQLLLGRVSSDVGDFEFPTVRARGDDELILQVQNLNGIRSPSVSIIVNDAELAGFDVTGAFAWNRLDDGQVGTVAIQMSPYGIDGRGVCPDHDESPQTCFTGGLNHSMVSIENLRVDGFGSASGVTWAPTPVTPDRPNVGFDGDVRAGPLDVVLVIDRSENAEADGLLRNPAAVQAITSFVGGLRQRDRVGVVTFGPTVERLGVVYTNGRPTTTGLFSGLERSTLISNLQSVLQGGGSGAARVFDAVEEAGEVLAGSRNEGRIVVITSEEHAGSVMESEEAYFAAFEAIDTSLDPTRRPTRVDVIGLSLARTDKFDDLRSITTFTGGEYFGISAVQAGDVNQLELVLSDIRSTLSGSFLLLYDISIPPGVGKAARLEFDARMNGVMEAVSYSGLLRVDLAAN